MYSIGPERYRLFGGPGTGAPLQASGLQTLPTPAASQADESRPWHPSSPLFAFGVAVAAAGVLMVVGTGGQASAGVHVGKIKAAVSGAAGVGK